MKWLMCALICCVVTGSASARGPRREWFNDFRRNETRGPLMQKPCECRPSNPSRVEFRPTGPSRPYYGYVDPHPLRVDVRNIGDVPIGKQFQITSPSYTTPDGVVHYISR